MQSNIAQKDSIYICISLSGETKFIVNALKKFNEKKINTFLLSQHANSSASKYTKNLLLTPQKKNLALTDSISDQFSLLILTDIILHYIFMAEPLKYKTIYDMTIIDPSQE